MHTQHTNKHYTIDACHVQNVIRMNSILLSFKGWIKLANKMIIDTESIAVHCDYTILHEFTRLCVVQTVLCTCVLHP